MRLVFMGSPDSARFCLEKIMDSGFSVELVITQPDRPAGRGKRLRPSPVKAFAEERDLPVLQPARIRKDAETRRALQDIQPDLIVVAAYGQIIPRSIIYLPKYNTINVHYSLLPRFRGASPVQGALLNMESETGVTIFELDEKMDEGPIYSSRRTEILPGENAEQLENRLTRIGAQLLIETIPAIPDMRPIPQNHDAATYANLIRKQDGRIDWNGHAARIDARVRAFTPWPSAFTSLGGVRIKILSGRPLRKKPEKPGTPGRIAGIDGTGIRVECGEGSFYLIEDIQPENRKAMPASAFARGARLEPGGSFE